MKFFETSAWTNVNIAQAFTALAENILDDVRMLLLNDVCIHLCLVTMLCFVCTCM